MKGYTEFATGFLGPEALGKVRREMRYFDWEKAKDIIDNAIEENPYCDINIGLREDWNNTSDTIYCDGEWSEPYFFYGCSCWATPIIDINGEEIECWTNEETKEKEGIASWVYTRV